MDQYDPGDSGDEYKIQSDALAGWFLGPRAENSELFNKLVLQSFTLHEENRRKFYPTDPAYVSDYHKASDAYKAETKQLEEKLKEMNAELQQSTPIFSPRFQGHMNWDITMPSFLGYISGMLWNPNNVDVTASPVTTPYEILAAKQICNMIGFEETEINGRTIEPWGHITCGGSIANIEALWSSRNLKFYALSLQDAVEKEPSLAGAKNVKVVVPAQKVPELLGDKDFIELELGLCNAWQLLNLDVDEACDLARKVADAAGVSMNELSETAHKHTYTSRGIYDFLKDHNVQSPRAFCPATCHYSWPKAATVLGLGEDNLMLVEVDRDARQDLEDLKRKLDDCIKNNRPVISVTAVMGSTEESAMDDLVGILEIREIYRKKGLNFCVLGDAAWGAYMMTTLREPEPNEPKNNKTRPREMANPVIPLSDHVKNNLMALRRADTVTSDPHKTGYCPYPAGGLSYRNGTMKEFVLLAAPEVFHSADDLSVGVNGLEGSKPGAAAAGVLLSHRVVGLDKYGYGRILGQCVFGSKMFYCMWTHLAKEKDPFVIEMYKECTPQQKKDMETLILGKTNNEICRNAEAMKLLREVGPDALINKFGMNVKIGATKNQHADVATDFTKKVGQILSVNADKNNSRVSMVMFQSMMEPKTFGNALVEFEKSLGISEGHGNTFACMVNTVMNPWQTSSQYITALGDIFRAACFNAYGWMYEKPALHTFVVCGEPEYSSASGWTFFAVLSADFGNDTNTGSDCYHVIAKFKAVDQKMGRKIQEYTEDNTVFFRNSDGLKMYDLLEEVGREEKGLTYQVSTEADFSGMTMPCSLQVVDVIRMDHFQPPDDVQYPKEQTYVMFGEGKQVFLSHVLTKKPDFQQVVQIQDPCPFDEDDELLLWYGLKVTFPDLPVDPKRLKRNPFTDKTRKYRMTFTGREQEKREMMITLVDNQGWYEKISAKSAKAKA